MHSKDDRVASSADSGAHPGRTFLDVEGTRWQVYEQSFGDYDRRSGMSLIFASEAAVRRVRDFPSDWRLLTDEALLALSWNA